MVSLRCCVGTCIRPGKCHLDPAGHRGDLEEILIENW